MIPRLLLIVLLVGGCNSNSQEPDEGTPPVDDTGGVADRAGGKKDGGAKKDTKAPVYVEPTWLTVEAGSCKMGSPAGENCRRDDEDQHDVTITRGFELAETEVTQEQFQSLMGYNPSFQVACGAQCPVDWVTWHEAVAYCNTLSAAKGLQACYACTGDGPSVSCDPVAPTGKKWLDCTGFRLPTEAEFEYAARAGTTTALPNGNISSCMSTDTNSSKIAWYKANSSGLPRAVKGKAANAWGFYDLTGNAYEWVQDWYQAKLGVDAVTDPVGPASGDASSQRVFRGGAWYFNAEHLRPAHRLAFAPTKRFTYLGFRCARTR
jgi:formylglycine-generating enzyme required for sulfatase activity